MAGFVEETGRKHGIKEALWMTLGVSDGQSLYAIRYASYGDAPSLYHSLDVETVCHLNPELRSRFGPHVRAVVSEPIGAIPEIWQPVPQNSALVIRSGNLEITPFLD